jgi:lipopolysaccharide transport system ATP-binding protein
VKRQLTYEDFWALKDISFEVKRGETFGIIGRNGSGKSTLLKLLARVLFPDSGSILINGRTASFLELGIGFQPELTAAENVYIYSSVLGRGRRRTDCVYEAIFEFAELKRFEDMKLKNFSSGMYARLAFSTAIHTEPDTLLIDEVLAVGDEPFQKKCSDTIYDLRKKGSTIIFVSHDLVSVGDLCQRALLLDAGNPIIIDSSDKVIEAYHRLLQAHV